MKKITVTLDAETAEKARVQAAKRKMSLSRYIREAVRSEVGRDDAYEAAYRAWRAEKPLPLKGPPEALPKREELYDRPTGS
jgi:predicted transcriptional regulator